MGASGDAVGGSRQSCWRGRGGHGGCHAQHGLRGPGGELRWALGSLRMERHRGRLREGGLWARVAPVDDRKSLRSAALFNQTSCTGTGFSRDSVRKAIAAQADYMFAAVVLEDQGI